MSRKRIKWGAIERYCTPARGFTIEGSGGDKVVKGPPLSDSKRNTVRVGHKSCRNKGTEVLECYISQLTRVFGIKREDLE